MLVFDIYYKPTNSLKIVDNTLVFDIYYKPTNSSNYVTYSSSHPSHTKNNIALSLVTLKKKRLSKLKKHLTERNQTTWYNRLYIYQMLSTKIKQK